MPAPQTVCCRPRARTRASQLTHTHTHTNTHTHTHTKAHPLADHRRLLWPEWRVGHLGHRDELPCAQHGGPCFLQAQFCPACSLRAWWISSPVDATSVRPGAQLPAGQRLQGAAKASSQPCIPPSAAMVFRPCHLCPLVWCSAAFPALTARGWLLPAGWAQSRSGLRRLRDVPGPPYAQGPRSRGGERGPALTRAVWPPTLQEDRPLPPRATIGPHLLSMLHPLKHTRGSPRRRRGPPRGLPVEASHANCPRGMQDGAACAGAAHTRLPRCTPTLCPSTSKILRSLPFRSPPQYLGGGRDCPWRCYRGGPGAAGQGGAGECRPVPAAGAGRCCQLHL